jgi:CheY-like chemotaxis protein/PAS domain-containing protein
MLGTQVAGLALAEFDYIADRVRLTATAANMFGIGEQEISVPIETVHATFHADDRELLSIRIAECRDPLGNGWFTMDHRVVWPNGEVRWLRVSKRVIFEGQGNTRHPHRAMLAALDVTEEKSATQALRQADTQKNVFIATLAHELRNPLAPIRNVVGILRQEPSATNNLIWCRDVLERQVEHMARLLEDLLDISRISSGKIVLRRADHISSENLGTVFDMFNQVDADSARSQGGIGIGLALVKGLVKLHGGDVCVRSEGRGQGSEFTVFLPLVDRLGLGEGSAVGPTYAATRKHSVLIVDDSRDSADSLAMLLQSHGHEVQVAYCGEDAIEMADRLRPTTILLDLGMPVLNGYETCQRIRALPWANSIVIIAQSGWGQREDRRRAREAGFDHHMVKPLDPIELSKLLQGSLLQGS